MRIISGRAKGRKLFTPPDTSVTRPIPDLVKGALFNLLRGHFEGATVFDGFSGTGSVGLEAASRGAARVVCVEKNREIAAILRRNTEHLGLGDAVELITGDALGPAALSRCPRPLHIAFLDPPYPLVRDAAGWGRVRAQMTRLVSMLDDGGFAVVRTPHPFLHTAGGGEPEPDRPARGRGRRAPRDRRPTREPAPRRAVSLDLGAAGSDAAIDAFEAGLASPSADPDPPKPDAAKPEPVEADLEVEGAIGPETHAYGQTAIHLYMRDRGGGGVPESEPPAA